LHLAEQEEIMLEQLEYIRAARCLINHPPITGSVEGAKNVWDELHRTHIWQGNYIHYVGHFLPWHRYLIRAHELLLQRLCGYNGAQPYWDELGDYESGSIHEAAIFDPVFGFGGDGGEDSCIQDGPFRDLTLHMSRESNYANYCLSRSFDQQWFTWANRSNIEECFVMTEYNDAWQCYNEFPHSAGHAVIGGVMGDPVESSGDPIFYLHHAYLDRLWWQWQQADEASRLTAIGGANVPPQSILDLVGLHGPDPSLVDYNGDEGDMTTLRHILWLHGIVPNATVADVLDLGGEVICATYE
jgi:tyrosinase